MIVDSFDRIAKVAQQTFSKAAVATGRARDASSVVIKEAGNWVGNRVGAIYKLANLQLFPNTQGSQISITVVEGIAQSNFIKVWRLPNLEHGLLLRVNGIVLHQTSSTLASPTLYRWILENNEYEDRLREIESQQQDHHNTKENEDNALTLKTLNEFAHGEGTHFLIARDGTIFQTARIDRICFHVGYIRARCLGSGQCTEIDRTRFSQINLSKGSLKEKNLELHQHETPKKYGDRYPFNNDSIGIELAGSPSWISDRYPPPTIEQRYSLKWLMGELFKLFPHLAPSDVYSHGEISPHKNQTEAVLVKSQWLEDFKISQEELKKLMLKKLELEMQQTINATLLIN